MATGLVRHQTHIGDGHQLFHPDELKEGMHIGEVSIFEGTPRRLRVAQAAASFTIWHQEAQGRLQSALRLATPSS